MITDRYPDAVTVGGVTYLLNLSLRRVLLVMAAQDDKLLSPEDRLEVQVKTLLKRPRKCPKDPEAQAELMKAIMALFPKGDQRGQKAIDFKQDERLIRSAFMRMGYDLIKDDMHFFRFCELLSDVPGDTALARTIDIRLRPIPKATKYNADQIKALQEAKARVAIKMSDDEARERFMESLKMSAALRG